MSQAGQFYQKTLVSTLTGDTGGAVGPVAGNIDLVGGAGIAVDGFPGISTLTITASGMASSFVTDAGTATPVAGAINVLGGSNIHSSGAGNTITLDLDDDVTISGQLEANEIESITYINALTSISALTGDITAPHGDISAGGQMVSTGDITSVSGDITALAGNLTIVGTASVSGNITSSAGNVISQNDVISNTGDIYTSLGSIISAATITSATTITSTAGDIVAAGGNMIASGTITGMSGLRATAGGVIVSAGDVTVTLGDIETLAGSIDSASTISAVGNITSSGGDIQTTVGDLISGNDITATNDISTTAGTISSFGTITSTNGNIETTTGSIDSGSTISAVGDITSSTGDIVSTNGDLRAPNGTLFVNTFSATGDIISSGGDLIATVGDVKAGNKLYSGAGLEVTTGNIDVLTGRINVNVGGIEVNQNIVSLNGSIFATNGDITAGYSIVAGSDITSVIGDITASAGDITAKYDVESISGNINALAGNITTSVGFIRSAGALIADVNLQATGTVQFTDITDGYLKADATGFVSSVDFDQDNMLYVGKHGDDANSGLCPSEAKLTIQAAVTAAAAGDTIIVYPGTYEETITHAASNVTILGQGKPSNCIITQADANVIDFATFSGIQYKFFGISCTAATSAIWTVEGSTGVCSFKECQISMTSAADIAAVAQPGVGRVTGAGTLSVILGKAYYYHTGNGGGTANKGAFATADGGLVSLSLIEDLTVSNSGTALVSGIGIDTASTGNINIHDCIIHVTDPNATIVVGLAYLDGTGTDSEFYRNTIHVQATNNTAYGFFSADTASTSRFFFNHVHVEDAAGASYSYLVGNTATVTVIFDDVVAADGASVAAGGIFYEVKSPVDGDMICSGPTAAGNRNITVANTDNTATASNACVCTSVGGATSTGDPYTNYLVTGAGTYSVGIDNTDSDNFKITSGATPSAGTDLFTMTSAGVITLNNDLDVASGGTGVSTLTDHGVLIGNAAADITATAEGATGTFLTGVTGDQPVWTTATYPATAAIGTILIASGANVITTLAPDTAGYVLTDGGAGAAPSWAAQTVGTVTSVTAGTNISNSGTAADPVMDLDAAITGMTSITMADTGSIQTTTTDTDTMLIQGYDVDGTAYVPFITITNADDPTCDLNTGVTIGSKYIYRADGTDVPVADGGTGASTFTDGGLLVGATTGPIEALAVGGAGTILTGVAGANPAWTTATYPATVTQGDLLVASAANVIGVVAGGTATHVLTANGAGAAPTYQAAAAAAYCSDAEAIAGTVSDESVSPSTLKAKLGAQTSHGLPYGAATTGAIAWTAEPSDGQLLMGDTGAIPQLGTLTAGTGITVTNAAHSITVASTGTTVKNETGTTYTLTLTDAGKFITFTNGAAIAVTVPTNASVAFPIGTQIGFQQGGAGQATFAGAAPPTLKSADDAYTTVKLYSVGALIKIAEDVWAVAGDMEA